MGRATLVLLGLLVFAGSTWYGYRLTEESFAWLDKVPTAAPAAPATPSAPATMPSPSAAAAYLKTLSQAKIDCLKKAVGPDRVQAALKGQITQPTPQEALAISQCLK